MKAMKIGIGILGALVILWGAMIATDAVRCSSLQEPLFAVAIGTTADDGGSGLYQGLGYSVRVEKHLDAEYGVVLDSVEMTMFGKVVAASIT